jgi:hypothetical protein
MGGIVLVFVDGRAAAPALLLFAITPAFAWRR